MTQDEHLRIRGLLFHATRILNKAQSYDASMAMYNIVETITVELRQAEIVRDKTGKANG